MSERANGVLFDVHRISLDGPPERSILRLFSGDALWHERLAVGPHRDNDFVVAISSPKKQLIVVSSPSPPGSFLSWTNGTCVGFGRRTARDSRFPFGEAARGVEDERRRGVC